MRRWERVPVRSDTGDSLPAPAVPSHGPMPMGDSGEASSAHGAPCPGAMLHPDFEAATLSGAQFG